MDFRKEIAIQGIINAAVKSEQICLKQDRFQMLFGSVIAMIVTPIVFPLLFIQYKDDLKFAAKYAVFLIHALCASVVMLPLIFIDIAKVGTISMWYADKAYQLFKGEKLKVADENGELYEFDEERYEAWMRKAIASSK